MKKALIGILVLGFLASGLQAADKGRLSIEDRLERLERQAQSLSDLLIRLQQIEGEIKVLRGQLEVQQNQMETQQSKPQESARRLPADTAAPAPALPLERESRDERDSPAPTPRSSAVPPASGGTPALPPAEGNRASADSRQPSSDYDDEAPPEAPERPAPRANTSRAPTPTGGEALGYQQAFELLNQGRYTEASEAFQDFLTRYPDGKHAENAQYWLGETRYATRDFPAALREFQRLLSRNPQSSKASSALLKIGYIQIEQGETAKARETLSNLVKRYPDSTEAKLAQQRLSRLR
ncbi:MAG: tol-pal system protein YbgF [Pseudomonadota bacterium]